MDLFPLEIKQLLCNFITLQTIKQFAQCNRNNNKIFTNQFIKSRFRILTEIPLKELKEIFQTKYNYLEEISPCGFYLTTPGLRVFMTKFPINKSASQFSVNYQVPLIKTVGFINKGRTDYKKYFSMDNSYCAIHVDQLLKLKYDGKIISQNGRFLEPPKINLGTSDLEVNDTYLIIFAVGNGSLKFDVEIENKFI